MSNIFSSQTRRDASLRPGPSAKARAFHGQLRDDKEDGAAFPTPSAAVHSRAQAAGRPYLNTAQAAHYLGVGWRKLMRLRVAGTGPVFRRHGRLIVYHPDDLETWSRSRAGGAGADD